MSRRMIKNATVQLPVVQVVKIMKDIPRYASRYATVEPPAKLQVSPNRVKVWRGCVHSIVFFPLKQIPIRGWLVFVNCTLISGRVRCDGCGTILPITDCVREWSTSVILRDTSTVPFSRVETIPPKKLRFNNFFSDRLDGWSLSYKSRRCTGY